MNIIYIQHINLTNAPSGKTKKKDIFTPVDLSYPLISPMVKLLDPSLQKRNHSFDKTNKTILRSGTAWSLLQQCIYTGCALKILAAVDKNPEHFCNLL